MRITAAILAIGLTLGSGAVLAETSSDEWQYRLSPYLWLPTIDGTIKYNLPPGSGSPDVRIGPADWLDLLNYGVLVNGSARKGRISIFSDFVYLSMTSENGRVVSVEDTVTVPGTPITIPISASLNLNTRTDLDALLWMVAGGYTVRETETATLDLFAGLRFFGVEVATSWDLTTNITAPGGGVILPAQGSIKNDTDLWDGIVGIRGYFGVGTGNWSVPYYFDIGTGSSELTWHAMTGLSYAFDWGDLFIVYRHLEYDQDSDNLLQDFSFSGPAFGASFHF